MQVRGPNNVGKAVQTVPTLLHYALPSRSKRNVGSCWLKSLTGFKVCATTCNRVCERTQHVTSNIVESCWPTMLHPFARGLRFGVPYWRHQLLKSVIDYFIKGEIIRLAYRVAVAQHHGCCYPSGSGCKKRLKIKGTHNYYFKTIGYCSRTKDESPLFLRRFYATWPGCFDTITIVTTRVEGLFVFWTKGI